MCDLADRIGQVMDICEGNEGLAGHKHPHQFLSQRVLLLKAALVEQLQHHGDGEWLEFLEVYLAVELLGVALQSHQLADQDHELQVEVGRP